MRPFNQNRVKAMTQLTITIPDETFSALHKDQKEFTRDLRIAAAVKWYELEQISQARAAEIAGLSRGEFIDALTQYQVSPFQYSAEEVLEDLETMPHCKHQEPHKHA